MGGSSRGDWETRADDGAGAAGVSGPYTQPVRRAGVLIGAPVFLGLWHGYPIDKVWH